MTAIRIDSCHPVPSVRRGKTMKYPFETMQPGQSFAIEIGNATLQQVRNRLQNSLSSLRRRRPVEGQFITKKVGDELRCWRIK